MSELQLTPGQRRRLQAQLRRTSDARVYRRTLAILEIAQGKSVQQVAQTLGVTRQSVYNWIADYAQTAEPAALLDAEHPGRPSLWTDDTRQWLRSLLGQSPDSLGYFAVNWTAPLLQEELEHCTGQRFSDDTLRRELRRLGYVWKRPRYVLDPDPELEKKNAASAGKSGICGPGASCWQKMRPTCCSSRRCERVGRCGANPKRCICPAGTPAAWSSGP